MEPVDTSLLTATNVALGVACLVLLGVVAYGAVAEVLSRRRLRASLPDGWPPEGDDGHDVARGAPGGPAIAG